MPGRELQRQAHANRRVADGARYGPAAGLFWGTLILLLLVDPLAAGTGDVVSLPLPGQRVLSGLTLEVDSRWVDGSGYRPVQLRLSPALGGAAKADRRIQVELEMQSWEGGSIGSAATLVHLRQGQRVAETVVPVSCTGTWNSLRITVFEDGRVLEDLSERSVSWATRAWYQWTEASPSILVIDAAAPSLYATAPRWNSPGFQPTSTTLPDVRALMGQIPIYHWTGSFDATTFEAQDTITNRDLMRLIVDAPRLEFLPPESLPESWVNWTSVDLAFVSWSGLQHLKDHYPEKWQALRGWLATGPCLCVYGAGIEPGQLSELESLMELPALDGAQHQGWMPPTDQRDRELFDEHYYRWASGASGESLRVLEAAGDAVAEGLPFVFRPVEQGYMLVFAEEDPFPGSAGLWSWVLRSLEAQNWMWYRRHGLSLRRENREFWNWLVPGVGRAPVNAFLVFISLFVVGIGPVNYFFLRRRRRLYLLLVTVPGGALCVTLGLLCFALLTDGIQVRARTRSFTELDQRTRRSIAWSRQSYYAGLAPSSGLEFPVDAAVHPISFRPTSFLRRGPARRVTWREEQHFSKGFLPSRTPVQFLVLESRSTSKRLDFSGFEAGEPGPRVANFLGAGIRRLVVRGPDGDLYAAGPIAVSAEADLKAALLEQEASLWNSLLSPSLPKYPEGFDPSDIENAVGFFSDSYTWHNTADHALPMASLQTGLGERRFRAWITDSFAGLPVRSYLALVEEPIESTLGYPQSRREASVHAVQGRW